MPFRSALLPNKNAPMVAAIITITTAATSNSGGSDNVCFFDCEVEGDKLDEVLDVGVCVDDVESDGFGDCVEVGAAVGIGVFRLGAWVFGAVKKGVKVT